MNCRFCNSNRLETFVDLGTAPPSNAYLTEEDLSKGEKYYPLHAMVCTQCNLVQLDEFETPEDIFEDYGYFSSQSQGWLAHCKQYVLDIQQRFYIRSVCEIASNDGYLLQYFDPDLDVIGVEPAKNVAEVAKSRGIETLCDFWSTKFVQDEELIHTFDLIIGNNVLAHTPNLNDFVKAVELALGDGGIATFEVPHLMALIEGNQWDTIYHEHFSYFSYLFLRKLFSKHGLSIFDVDQLPTHGGSLRVYVCRYTDTRKIPTGRKNKPNYLFEEEERKGYGRIDIYKRFDKKVKEQKLDIMKRLLNLRLWNQRIVCYGAPAKGNTVLNYCGIDRDLIDYVVDSTPYKQGRFLPGSRIPIYSPDILDEDYVDIIWVMPWNHKEEILKKLESNPSKIMVGPTMEFYSDVCQV